MTRAQTVPKASHTSRQKSRRAYVPQILLSLLLGVALIGLAVPRTIAAWSSLKGVPAFEKLWAGKPPTDGELTAAAAGLARAVAAVPSGEKLVDLGVIELLQARASGLDEAQRADLLANSERHLNEALLANPAQAFGWLKLAEVRILQSASGRDVAVALMHSVDVAPNMRLAWIPRAGLLLRYWRYLDGDELPSFIYQLRTIWSATPAYRTALIEAATAADQMEVVAAAVDEPPPTTEALKEMQARQAMKGRKR